MLRFRLRPTPPFRLDLTVWALRRRPSNLIDRWDGHAYRRVLALAEHPTEVTVTQKGTAADSWLEVTVTGTTGGLERKASATAALERLLGFKRDLSEFYRVGARDPRLAALAARFRGVKPPRFPDLFEALVNAVACQQLSLSLGILLLSRLAAAFGPSVRTPASVAQAFPRPADLAGLDPAVFRELGFSLQKGRAIIELARLFGENPRLPAELEALPNDYAVARLLELRGIGRWSAEYALLRGLGRLDIYPGDDVGARNNLKRWLRLRKPLDYDGVRRVTARWQPYAGLVYFHMLLEGLRARGILPIPAPT